MKPPGLRNIKTAIAIFSCLLLYSYIGREGVIFAVMAILICMQSSVEKTILEGVSRIIGTIVGAVAALGFLSLIPNDQPMLLYYFLCILGLVVIIHALNTFKMHKSIALAGIVYLVIILGAEDNPLMYSIDRAIDTLFGIVLAIVINRYLFRPTALTKKVSIFVKSGEETLDHYTIDTYQLEEHEKEMIYTIELDQFVKGTSNDHRETGD